MRIQNHLRISREIHLDRSDEVLSGQTGHLLTHHIKAERSQPQRRPEGANLSVLVVGRHPGISEMKKKDE